MAPGNAVNSVMMLGSCVGWLSINNELLVSINQEDLQNGSLSCELWAWKSFLCRELDQSLLMMAELRVLKLKDLYDLDSLSLANLGRHQSLKRVYIGCNGSSWTQLHQVLSSVPQLVELSICDQSAAHSSPALGRRYLVSADPDHTSALFPWQYCSAAL